jgi:hypothetical protein
MTVTPHVRTYTVGGGVQAEFALMFFAIGFKFCCSHRAPFLLLDVVIVCRI